MSDTFSHHPVSVTEARAFRENDCTKLSPRDLLIGVLRGIDSGEFSPTALVVCWTYEDDGHTYTRLRQASPDPLITTGMLTKCAMDLWHD